MKTGIVMEKHESEKIFGKLDRSVIHDLYNRMQRTRLVEEEVRQICLEGGSIKCSPHLYHGQEAVAAGVCANLTKGDYLFSNHRSHGHYIAANGKLGKFFAKLFGKKPVVDRGKAVQCIFMTRMPDIWGAVQSLEDLCLSQLVQHLKLNIRN